MSKDSVALDAAIEEIADLKDMIEHVSMVEYNSTGAHIPVSWETFGDVSVGLDVAGNAVAVSFGAPYWEVTA